MHLHIVPLCMCTTAISLLEQITSRYEVVPDYDSVCLPSSNVTPEKIIFPFQSYSRVFELDGESLVISGHYATQYKVLSFAGLNQVHHDFCNI